MIYAIWLLPLLGAIVCWAFGPQLRRVTGVIGSALVGIPLLLTFVLWITNEHLHVFLFSWLGGFDLGLLFDPLSLIWTLIITGVGFLILVYSIGYMWADGGFARFFAYMDFFIFAMLTLVLSDNFVGLLIGWGLVGLASYFLIGFWFNRPSAVAAARKAFVINVVGDVAIMFAIFILFAKIGSLTFAGVFASVHLLGAWLFWTCLFLFIGAAAKSAQIPLHTWLPDAMEGPTPVSALIHAATMVTAGVYLIARCWPLWNASHDAQLLAGTTGAVTALAAAVLGVGQWDIKRILAYSTMSQIGYMIMGVGVTAYPAGVAHFFTHAFFKACLFLGAGIVIHELSDEQDIRKMGGMRTRAPVAFWAMLAAVLAICGFPFFSGFFSKDADVYGVLAHAHPWMSAAGVLTAGITAYYMFRLFILAFFGTYRGDLAPELLGIDPLEAVQAAPGTAHEPHDVHAQGHAPAWIMALPVGILGFFSVVAGYVMIGSPSPWTRFFIGTLQSGPAHPLRLSEGVMSVILIVVMFAGIALAFARYGTRTALADAPARLRRETERMPAIIVHLYYVDEAIEWLVVKPAQALGSFFGRWLDPHLIDGSVREIVFANRWAGALVRSFQTGMLRAYALIVVFGAMCFAVYYGLIGGFR